MPLEKGGAITFDASGWPTTDFKVLVFDTRVHMPWNDNGKDPQAVAPDESGTWHLSCKGQAVIAPTEAGMCEIQNLKYDEALNLTTADLVVPANVNLLALQFTDTHSAPSPGANSTEQGVKNLRIVRPGYPADTEKVFTDRYLKGLQPFDTIRLMDYLSTNMHSHPARKGAYPKLENWEDRRLTTDAYQADGNGKYGGAWEYGIDLVNQLKKNVWVCVPIGASDDYVEHLANLLKSRLDPNLILYVEYSNEVWNWGFCQSWWNKTNAEAQKNKEIDYVITYANRSAEIATIFKKVFGPSAMISRVRPVLCWQISAPASQEKMCKYINSKFGNPKELFYALSASPYYNSKETASVDACIAGMEKACKEHGKHVSDLVKVAKGFGLHVVAYEGGPGLNGEEDLEFKLAANRDPRIAGIIKNFIQNDWIPAGGELFLQYNYVGSYGRYGAWGIIEPNYNFDNLKYQAYLQLIGKP